MSPPPHLPVSTCPAREKDIICSLGVPLCGKPDRKLNSEQTKGLKKFTEIQSEHSEAKARQQESFSDILRYSRLLMGVLFDDIRKLECRLSNQIIAKRSNTSSNLMQINCHWYL
jgi:hypothetical protein